MTDELTLGILEEALEQLPLITYAKQMRISYGDYRRLREACDVFQIFPEQLGGYTLGFCGEWIIPDVSIQDNHYKVDWQED